MAAVSSFPAKHLPGVRPRAGQPLLHTSDNRPPQQSWLHLHYHHVHRSCRSAASTSGLSMHQAVPGTPPVSPAVHRSYRCQSCPYNPHSAPDVWTSAVLPAAFHPAVHCSGCNLHSSFHPASHCRNKALFPLLSETGRTHLHRQPASPIDPHSRSASRLRFPL